MVDLVVLLRNVPKKSKQIDKYLLTISDSEFTKTQVPIYLGMIRQLPFIWEHQLHVTVAPSSPSSPRWPRCKSPPFEAFHRRSGPVAAMASGPPGATLI